LQLPEHLLVKTPPSVLFLDTADHILCLERRPHPRSPTLGASRAIESLAGEALLAALNDVLLRCPLRPKCRNLRPSVICVPASVLAFDTFPGFERVSCQPSRASEAHY
jgi:hypothetical protein